MKEFGDGGNRGNEVGDPFFKYRSIAKKRVSPIFPVIPDSQVFPAILMHIELDGPILSQIAAELGLCVGGVDDCSGGMMVGVVRDNDKKVRARVLEGEGCDLMNLVDIDSGEVFRTSRQDQVQASHLAFSLNCESTFFTPYSLRGIARGGRDRRKGESCIRSCLDDRNTSPLSISTRFIKSQPSPSRTLIQLSPFLLSLPLPPLAIPLKLYGVKKVDSQFSEKARCEACTYVRCVKTNLSLVEMEIRRKLAS